MNARPLSGGWMDATLPIGPTSTAWVGLPLPRLGFDATIQAGLGVNAGRLECSLHSGTHADAPFHIDDDGPTSDAMDPGVFVGPARLVRLADVSSISIEALRAAGLSGLMPSRLLLATSAPFDGRRFPASVPALEAEAAEWLVTGGVRLVGVDQPSVDPLHSRTMDAHKALFRGGAAILENLALAGLETGEYELVAAPILILGADAAPCRALLRPLGR